MTSAVVVCVDGEDLALQGPCPAGQHMAVESVELPFLLEPSEFLVITGTFWSLIIFMYLMGLAVGFVKRHL